MPRVKKRKLTPSLRALSNAITPPPKARPLPFKDLIAARLGEAKPLTHNGRIKSEFRSAADEICCRLMEDARAGKLNAIRLLVECTEGDIIKQDTVNYLVERVYNAITQFITDEDTLFKIGQALFHIKHSIHPFCRPKAPKPIYTSPAQLDPTVHENPYVQTRLTEHQSSRAERRAILEAIPHPIPKKALREIAKPTSRSTSSNPRT